MSEVVRRYYDGSVEFEWNRLARAYGRLEFESTCRLIDEYFPSEGRVADIGGGPGRYAIELARRGYRVSLFDVSEEAIRFAQQRFEEQGLGVEAAARADATDLSGLPSSSYDAGLLLGPLYHLVDEENRLRALNEFRRILRPGAPGLVGFINPWGILRAGLEEFPDVYADGDRISRLLGSTVQVGEQRSFTEAAFLTPPQALSEIRSVGLAVETRAGVEGFASGMLVQVARIAEDDPAAYDHIVRLAVETSVLPAFRDCTEHLHVVVRKLG